MPQVFKKVSQSYDLLSPKDLTTSNDATVPPAGNVVPFLHATVSNIKTEPPFKPSMHIDSQLVTSVKNELARIHTKENNSSPGRKRSGSNGTLRGRGVLGDPASTLGAEEVQLWKQQQWAQLGWVAGFVDGEGCITVVRNIRRDRPNDSARIRVIVCQNDYSVLEFAKNVLDCGGCINTLKRQSAQNRQMYQLQYDGPYAVRVLLKLRNLLHRKQAEADACLRFFIEGQFGIRTGRRGLDPEIVKIRNNAIRRLQRMK